MSGTFASTRIVAGPRAPPRSHAVRDIHVAVDSVSRHQRPRPRLRHALPLGRLAQMEEVRAVSRFVAKSWSPGRPRQLVWNAESALTKTADLASAPLLSPVAPEPAVALMVNAFSRLRLPRRAGDWARPCRTKLRGVPL